MKKNCEWCSVEFEIAQGRWATGKHAHRFCGRKCRVAFRHHAAKPYGPFVCKGCGAEFRTRDKDRTRFHSRECAYASKGLRKAPRKDRLRKEKTIQSLGKILSLFTLLRRCQCCGTWCLGAHCNRGYCKGWVCREHRGIHTKPYQAECANCGVKFFVLDGRGRGKQNSFCGKRCQLKYHKRKREVRLAQGCLFAPGFADVDIFRRDRWTCMLCGKRVKKGVSVPHPLAATIDHIRPVHLWGQHIESNVQCAHFICNSAKGAKFKGQLRLAVNY